MMAEYIPLRCAIIVLQLWHKGGAIMPLIMPIRDLRKTSEISELAHTKQEPIFITKNGYSDLVVMSALHEFIKSTRPSVRRKRKLLRVRIRWIWMSQWKG